MVRPCAPAHIALPAYACRPQHVHQNTYRLHALLLARAPYLAHLLASAPRQAGDRVLFVPLEHEPEITPEVRAVPPFFTHSLTVSRASQ
jgi:hypothetical protein